jgi:hypothetical protein
LKFTTPSTKSSPKSMALWPRGNKIRPFIQ